MEISIVPDTEMEHSRKRNIYKEIALLVWKTLAKHNKLILSILYVSMASIGHALTLIFTNNKVANRGRNSPLPDIFLDNFAYVPWAFSATETMLVYLFSIWLVMLIFHKYRFVVLRRSSVLIATIYTLRCVTMCVTTLPPPDTHITCRPKMKYLFRPMAQRVSGIVVSFGMTLMAEQSTCGDYIFSGHAAMLTFLSCCIRKYTSSRFYPLHVFTWISNLVGMFLILASHEHYTIDVLLSYYIVQQIFNSYHVFAHYKSIYQSDCWTGIWRPLFVFFESDNDGVVPNEFESPLPRIKTLLNYKNHRNRRVI